MNYDLLDLKSPHWSFLLLYVLPSLVNLGLFIYASVNLPSYRINRIFSLFILLLAVAQLSDGLMHISNTIETATAWQRIAFAPWVFITSVGVLFILSFRKTPLPKLIYGILFFPAIILELLIIGRNGQFEMMYNDSWGWVANPQPVLFNHIAYGFIAIVSLLMPILLWLKWKRNAKGSEERRTFLLLAVGVTIPYVGGLIGEVLFPLVFKLDIIPLAGPLMSVFSISALIAIKKYKLLAYSPRNHSDRILETINDGIMIADTNNKIMYANPALCGFLGYELQQITGADVDGLILNKNIRVHEEFVTAREFQVADHSGKLIWVVANRSPCHDHKGEVIGTIWTITNVDDLKKKGLEIKRNETRLNRAQEIAHIGHWELDFSSGKSLWSEEACRIYGLLPHERTQTLEAWISFIHPEDLPFVMVEVERGQRTCSDTDFEHRILLRDGTVKQIRSISKFEYDENQKPVGLYGVCQDITEIKITQERLQQTSSELETYIYKSSHDLHAPLSSILGLINVSKQDITDPVASRCINMIESQTNKLDVIRKEFIKAIQIKNEMRFDEEVNLNKMIADVLENTKSVTGYSRLNINVHVPKDQVMQSNEFLLRTILQNLVENAVKYQNYNQEHPIIDIDFVHGKENDSIIVSDNGMGIDPEIQDKIFEMYFRGTNTGNGSGLGLYLAKKAVDKLNGKLHLRSSEGSGTTFTLMFPREQPANVAA